MSSVTVETIAVSSLLLQAPVLRMQDEYDMS